MESEEDENTQMSETDEDIDEEEGIGDDEEGNSSMTLFNIHRAKEEEIENKRKAKRMT